jgi:hypothetical protein
MPGFLYKQTLMFETRGHGWSESMYFEQPTNDLATAQTFIATVKEKRALLLGKEASIKGERIALIRTDVGAPVKRQAILTKVFLPGYSSESACESNISLQVQMSNSTRTKKKLIFLGQPWRAVFPDVDSFNKNYPGWGTQFQQWRAVLQEKKMGWLYAVPVASLVITTYQFSSVTGHTTYTTNAPLPGAVAGEPIRVSVEFPLSRSPLDGVQIVVPGSTPNTYITAKPRPAQGFIIEGTMRLLGSQFASVEVGPPLSLPGEIVGQNPVSRKRGRPLLVSRGRLPGTARW